MAGDLPALDAPAPDFRLATLQLKDVSLADFSNRKKLLICLPSLDTPVCAAVARKFNARAGRLKEAALLLVSADLPFAQCRFCETEALAELTPLSSFRSDFGFLYGVLIKDGPLAGLLARALIMIDENDRIRYAGVVAELTEEPDYDSVFEALSRI